MDNKITIVIDMQNGFAKEGNMYSSQVAQIIPTVKEILENSKHKLFVLDSHHTGDLEMNLYPEHCIAGTWEADVVDELAEYLNQENTYSVTKNITNAFFDIPGDLWEKYEIFEFVGCCTDICVLQLLLTVKSYFNKREVTKPLIVYSNATATYDDENHNAEEFKKYALAIMEQSGIEVKEWKK
ncbi:cysteine hydrolase family protein [Mycoplasma phocoenae]|uniref:Cysteine hydrolase n=1 Tax=Mycoplasma phocoenae TaxID=754517 RepID=A0A858U2U7_9MOLU|nr:cysteine hydrolase [Mycoplasma phocoenae]QJG66800.1 cysteine hydrolase [Mycoplasma phocoenae]